MSDQSFVIVGASLTGARAAEALRQFGFDGRVVLIGSEAERPYRRPPLSKDYLGARVGLEKVYLHEPGFYRDHGIELRTAATVERIDATASEVVLAGGERLGYDRLLLATGAEPRRLSVPGAALEGIEYLRTLGDSTRLRGRIEQGGKLVVVGAGWIGCEVAATARLAGLRVTMIDPASVPLEHTLGLEVGAIYRDVHADHGVELLLGAHIAGFEGEGRVERVSTSDGRRVDCDFVVVGIGAVPRTELALGTGIAIDDGLITNQYLETGESGIFAAGDVANVPHPLFGRLRVEHWSNALHQGPIAARNMLGAVDPHDPVLDHPLAYDRIPYVYSDQYELRMEYSGLARGWDEVVFRGDVAGREFIAFWLKDERILAGMNVNVWDVPAQIQALIRSHLRVDPARLADPGTPLTELAPDRDAANPRR